MGELRVPVPRRRTWLRFSLRTLLITTAVVAALLAAFVQWREAKRRERAAADAILNRGGSVNTSPLRGAWVEIAAAVMPRSSLHTTTCVCFAEDATDSDLALLSDLPDITDLHIEHCSGVTPTGLAPLRGLRRMEVLYLKEFFIGDEGLAPLQSMRQLRELWVEHTGISDTSAAWIAQNVGLTHLDLDGNDISDAALGPLSTLEHLEVLVLRDTKITSRGLAAIAHMPRLKHLYLMKTSVDDSGLKQLESLPHLLSLDIRLTQVTEEGRARFHQVKPDCRFD